MADATSFLQGIAPLVAKINSDYPQLAPYLQNPEIAQIILEGASKNMTPTQFQGAIQASTWYKTKAPSERTWITTQLIDPARAGQLEGETSVRVRQIANQLGLRLTGAQVDLFAHGALQGGYDKDANELQRQLADFGRNQKLAPGQILATQQQMQKTASDYGIPIGGQALKAWATQVNDGSQTMQGFQAYAASQAKLAYPPLAKEIDQGLTIKQIGDPYAQIAATTLGIDPNSVDWSDPKWQKALQGRSKEGDYRGPMSHLDWKQTIMQDPAYAYAKSENGQTDAYHLMNTLKSAFGLNVLA